MSRKSFMVQSLHTVFVRNRYGCEKLNSLKLKKESRFMCLSCGCGDAFDNHGDSRNITLQEVDEAPRAAGTTRARVIQNMTQVAQALFRSAPPARGRKGFFNQSPPLEKQSG